MAARRLRSALQLGARQRLRAAAAPPGSSPGTSARTSLWLGAAAGTCFVPDFPPCHTPPRDNPHPGRDLGRSGRGPTSRLGCPAWPSGSAGWPRYRPSPAGTRPWAASGSAGSAGRRVAPSGSPGPSPAGLSSTSPTSGRNTRSGASSGTPCRRCTTWSPTWRTTRTSCPGARSRWWSPSGRGTSRPSWRWASRPWWSATLPSSPSSAPISSRPSARTGASSTTWRRTGASAPASLATPAPAPWISRSPLSFAPCSTPSWPPSSLTRWSSRWWQPSSAGRPRTSGPRPASPGSSCSTRSTRREDGPGHRGLCQGPGGRPARAHPPKYLFECISAAVASTSLPAPGARGDAPASVGAATSPRPHCGSCVPALDSLVL